jgi:UDP:flavonoid glycosyltransferase YjiC (YdhE family)
MVKRAVRQVVGDDKYRNAARNLQCAHARRDGVAAIAELVDEVVAERRLSTAAHPSHL